MPDIAMATSALAELHLFKRSSIESLARQPPPPAPPQPAPRGQDSYSGRYLQ